MLTFQLFGQIGSIAVHCGSLRVAVATADLWVTCESDDLSLRLKLLGELSQGDLACLEGDVRPRRREIGGVIVHDVRLELRGFRKLELRRWEAL
jgi:hypothetical protein